MSWLQMNLFVDAARAESLSSRLEDIGACAESLEAASSEPLFGEPGIKDTGLWKRTKLSALFEQTTDMQALLMRLATSLAPERLPHYEINRIKDQDWSRVWMDRFTPLRFGARLWIVPSWLTPPDPAAVNILLDPGTAFGTGTHATTGLCLEWLAGDALLSGARVIDYGCGSGILAIAAAKLGAVEVWAVDHDPQALIVTRENAEKNAIAGRVRTCLPDDLSAEPADVVIANILLQPLIDLAPRFARLLLPRGRVGVSGLLVEQLDTCAAAYAPWFVIGESSTHDEWGFLSGVRR
jgi:ribosomal protein L11 methyltransferase